MNSAPFSGENFQAIPEFTGMPPDICQQFATEAATPGMVPIDPSLIIAIARLAWAVIQACDPDCLRRSLEWIKNHPHGLSSMLVRHWIGRRVPGISQTTITQILEHAAMVASDNDRWNIYQAIRI